MKKNLYLFFVILLKLPKFFKIAKPGLALGTFIINGFIYAFYLGPWFGIGLLLCLVIHEFGHVIAMNKKNMKLSPLVFIPFLGAGLFISEKLDREKEAYIAYGGPLVGTLGVVVFAAPLLFIDQGSMLYPILIALIVFGMVINMFNMIPISPLDGGRITQAIDERSKYVGLFLLFTVSIVLKVPGILLIWIIILFDFNIINNFYKMCCIIILYSMMLFMYIMGLGQEVNNAIIIIDSCLGLFFVILSIVSYIYDVGEDPEYRHLRPQLDLVKKIKWSGLYLSLFAFQIAIIYITIPYLHIGE